MSMIQGTFIKFEDNKVFFKHSTNNREASRMVTARAQHFAENLLMVEEGMPITMYINEGGSRKGMVGKIVLAPKKTLRDALEEVLGKEEELMRQITDSYEEDKAVVNLINSKKEEIEELEEMIQLGQDDE